MEYLIRAVPSAILIGHGPGFWAEISADVTIEAKLSYPARPIRGEGTIQRLLRAYPNLYADLSARSGLNAIRRDPAYGIRFLNEFQDKLLYGTDVCFGDMIGRMPQLAYLRQLLADGDVTQAVFDKITSKNALGIFRQYRA